jgi:hypothetical protein
MKIDLNACPLCHCHDRSAGAHAVCAVYHLEHEHPFGDGVVKHTHMFYERHTHPARVFFDVEARTLCPVHVRFDCTTRCGTP